MSDFLTTVEGKGINMPSEVVDVLENCKKYTVFDTSEQLAEASVGGAGKKVHEIYSYNLYPGPSAKKGLYGALLAKGEKENWITAHCSTAAVISPYDSVTTFMHEGASGGGKSEMLQHIVREQNGEVVIGENLLTQEKRAINLPIFCSFGPVTDAMAL
jgi:hypothetical protein